MRIFFTYFSGSFILLYDAYNYEILIFTERAFKILNPHKLSEITIAMPTSSSPKIAKFVQKKIQNQHYRHDQ